MRETAVARRSVKRSRTRIMTAVAIVAAVLVVVVVGVLIGAGWEATPEPSSSLGRSGAFRVWLAMAAGLATAVATGFLAWFARRGVSGLLDRMDLAEAARLEAEEARQKAEEARRGVEEERDALVRRLSLPYLYGHALRREDLVALGAGAGVHVGDPLMGGGVAPNLYIRLPLGRLPQEVRLGKEESRELYAEIERAEQGDGEVGAVSFANVVLVVAVIDPHDDRTMAGITLFPNASRAGPDVASGVLHDWPSFREAVRQVAMHWLPSLTVFKRNLAKEQ